MLRRQAGQQPGLAARPGTEVEPDPVLAVDISSGQREDSKLAGLVLHSGPALGDRADRARVTMSEVGAERRPPGGPGAGRDQFIGGGQARDPPPPHRRPGPLRGPPPPRSPPPPAPLP